MPQSCRHFHEVLPGVIALGLIPFVYVGSYLTLLDGAAPSVYYNQAGEPIWTDETQYRWGGETARTFFAPANWIDRKLRPGYWGYG